MPFYGKDLTGGLAKDEIASFLHDKGVSLDYNKPATLDQLKRLSEEKLKLIYNSIQYTHNLVDISRVHAKDLEIERDKEYILTYSFPCQDLSLAGKRAGMADTSTRSGLLWEVERILKECEVKPQILLMENVTQVHGLGNDEHFKAWQRELEKMGYSNYWQDMSATDYAIPQTRNRTFMVSILGNYNYNFPKKVPLKLRLKDLLESNVDEKYYLTNKQIEQIEQWNSFRNPLDEAMDVEDKTSFCITAKSNTTMNASMLLIKNATKKGYLEAHEGDGIDISSRMESHRGTVQKGKSQTLTTMGGGECRRSNKRGLP